MNFDESRSCEAAHRGVFISPLINNSKPALLSFDWLFIVQYKQLSHIYLSIKVIMAFEELQVLRETVLSGKTRGIQSFITNHLLIQLGT